MFLNEQEITQIGFRAVGQNVQISSRAVFYDAEQLSLGDHVRIDDFCVLAGPITMGHHVHLSVGCSLLGEITIGNYCNLSYHTLVLARTDDFSGEHLVGPTVSEEFRAVIMAPVVLQDHCLLGARTTVLPGVLLEEGTATGAHTLINRSTSRWMIYTGTPARPFKERSSACTRFTTPSR